MRTHLLTMNLEFQGNIPLLIDRWNNETPGHFRLNGRKCQVRPTCNWGDLLRLLWLFSVPCVTTLQLGRPI